MGRNWIEFLRWLVLSVLYGLFWQYGDEFLQGALIATGIAVILDRIDRFEWKVVYESREPES